jgi:hypothetical protein
MLRKVAGVLVSALLLLGPAVADELADRTKAAEDLAGAGKFLEAMDALDDAATLVWDRAPLTFRKALWVAESPSGFGAYNPRETNQYAAGDEMIAYVEPVGFGWRKSGDMWQTDLAADVSIKDKDGKEIYSQKDFQKLALSSRVRNHEFMTRFTFTLTGLPAGNYTLATTLRDAISSKSGSFELPFVIK